MCVAKCYIFETVMQEGRPPWPTTYTDQPASHHTRARQRWVLLAVAQAMSSCGAGVPNGSEACPPRELTVSSLCDVVAETARAADHSLLPPSAAAACHSCTEGQWWDPTVDPAGSPSSVGCRDYLGCDEIAALEVEEAPFAEGRATAHS